MFRELGELLVGRDSTALIELIKNSYDADATEVTVFGHALGDTRHGYILISDNGTGMTEDQFSNGFLRIASRGKEEGDRRSLRYKRRFTGAKGIGRLAAHKLAELLKVTSIPGKELRSTRGVNAQIDWKLVENYQTLEQLAAEETNVAIIVKSLARKPDSQQGTEIRLERLRRAWTDRELLRFVSEVQSFSPPQFLLTPSRDAIKPHRFLFETPRIADFKQTAPFVPKLQGDFATGEDYWPALAANADWFVEIDGVTYPNSIIYQLTPTVGFRKRYPDARMQTHKVKRQAGHTAPRFHARILVREGRQGSGPLKDWASSNSGIRIFMEGFRVLPYGERSNDWLQLDRNYSERMRTSEYLTEFGFSAAEQDDDKDALLQSLPNRSYYGCVFLTQEGAPDLRMLVNREGFIPNDSFEVLTRLVRLGLDLTVRARAAAKIVARQGIVTQDQNASDEPQTMQAAVSLLSDIRGMIVNGQAERAAATLKKAEGSIQTFAKSANEEATMLRILASVGSQMSAFVHEINAALGMAEGVEKAIERLVEKETSSLLRRDLNRTLKSITDLRRQLERQASYLVDINSPDARRRRSRTLISDRFSSAVRLLIRVAEQRDVTIKEEIPVDIKSPPMFPAELTSVFTNLLTNAIKAAGKGGKIRASGKAIESGGAIVRVENTGIRVDVEEGERWFRAFESTTANVDSVLGQGMGLGLTITRNMLEQYGATIAFVKPQSPYSSAIEIHFPK